MLVPKIVHRNLDPFAVLDSLIQYRVDGLLRLDPCLQTCRVALEQGHADIYAAVDEAFDNARRQLLGVRALPRNAHRFPAAGGMPVH